MKDVQSSETDAAGQVDLLGRPAPGARCIGHQEEHGCWMADQVVHRQDSGTFQGRCRSMTCTSDAKRVRDRLSWSVADHVDQSKLCYFWTLTLADSGWIQCSNCESHKLGSESFNRFLTAVRKKLPWFKFIRFVEFTERGVFHIHLLTNAYLPISWVEEEWSRSTGGSYVTWVEWIAERERAARYVSKYLTLTSKTAGKKGLYPKRARRYCSSRGIRLLPRDGRVWEVWSKTYLRRKMARSIGSSEHLYTCPHVQSLAVNRVRWFRAWRGATKTGPPDFCRRCGWKPRLCRCSALFRTRGRLARGFAPRAPQPAPEEHSSTLSASLDRQHTEEPGGIPPVPIF